MSSVSIAASPCLRIRFGADDAPGLGVAIPVLGGDVAEEVFPGAVAAGRSGEFELFRQGRWLFGRAGLPAGDALEANTRQLYDSLLRAARDHALVRIWNYVPAINEANSAGLEHYRAFCRGRSLAFENRHGPTFSRHAPAASAVGSDGDALVVVFAAHAGAARHVENPRQTPAYEYPAEHGPRSPTFARASVLEMGGGPRAVFISGTASIRGHGTVAPGETLPQVQCTLDNLREISRACGLEPDTPGARHIKVYLRHAGDYAAVRDRLELTLVRLTDRVTYLRSDICRRELNVEIEVTIPHLPATP